MKSGGLLPNTTFMRGSVTPVQMEAAAAAPRSNLSFLVEYENILCGVLVVI